MTAGMTCPPANVDPTHEASSCPRRAIVGEPLADVRVGLCQSADREDDVNQREAEEHHRGDEQRVPDEERDDEDPDGVVGTDPIREPLGNPSGSRLEHGWACACSWSSTAGSRSRGRVSTAGPAAWSRRPWRRRLPVGNRG